MPPAPASRLVNPSILSQVLAYREHVNAAMTQLLLKANKLPQEALALIELGLNHEQQHQELLLTDVLHLLSCNPLITAESTCIESQPNAYSKFHEICIHICQMCNKSVQEKSN